MMPWAGLRSTLTSGGCLFLSSGRFASCHVMLLYEVVQHAFGLSFYVEAMIDVAQEHQPQVVVDVVVHSHVITNHVNTQRAVTFPNGLLIISVVTHGGFGDHIMGKKSAETCHDLGVISIYVIRCDKLFRLRQLEDLHHIQE